MSGSIIFIEGGGDSNTMRSRCREGFRKLLEKCGHKGQMPSLKACGSRNEAFDYFKTAVTRSRHSFIGLFVDSEDMIEDIERTWEHLKKRDNWEQPSGTTDEQVLLMTTCMETWIIADRDALKSHYKKLQASALPAVTQLEMRHRHDVHKALEEATKNCINSYRKGTRSFEILALLNLRTLEKHLPSFVRMVRILREGLNDE